SPDVLAELPRILSTAHLAFLPLPSPREGDYHCVGKHLARSVASPYRLLLDFAHESDCSHCPAQAIYVLLDFDPDRAVGHQDIAPYADRRLPEYHDSRHVGGLDLHRPAAAASGRAYHLFI